GRRPESSGCRRLDRLLPPGGPEILAGLLIDLTHAKLHFAAVVEPEHLDFDRIAHLDDIGDLADPLRGKFANMNEPVARTEKVDEGAEIHDLDDLSGIDQADFGLGNDPADPLDRPRCGVAIDGGDLDGAVIVDVDLGPGGLGDLADDFSAGADHLADLFLRDGKRRYA